MTIRISYNQLEGLIKMVKGKSGKKFKKGKKQKSKSEYNKNERFFEAKGKKKKLKIRNKRSY
jgi:uncharacterized protein YxeA